MFIRQLSLSADTTRFIVPVKGIHTRKTANFIENRRRLYTRYTFAKVYRSLCFGLSKGIVICQNLRSTIFEIRNTDESITDLKLHEHTYILYVNIYYYLSILTESAMFHNFFLIWNIRVTVFICNISIYSPSWTFLLSSFFSFFATILFEDYCRRTFFRQIQLKNAVIKHENRRRQLKTTGPIM